MLFSLGQNLNSSEILFMSLLLASLKKIQSNMKVLLYLQYFLHCKCYLVSFSRYKTAFLPNIMPPKYAEQAQIDAKWLGKKLFFWRVSQRVGRSLMIVNKSMKEIENLNFSVCKIEFYFTHEHQNLYFHSWLPPLVKTLHLIFIRWNKIRSYTEKIKYPLFIKIAAHSILMLDLS